MAVSLLPLRSCCARVTNAPYSAGDVFLKNAYYSTDVGKNEISLAKLV